MGTVPVWPPPSPPWAMSASTPIAATFSAWRLAPTVGITTRPASLSFWISGALGAWAKLATRTPSRIITSARSKASG